MDEEMGTRLYRQVRVTHEGIEYPLAIPVDNIEVPNEEIERKAINYLNHVLAAKNAIDHDQWFQSMETAGYLNRMERVVWRLVRQSIVAGDDDSGELPENLQPEHYRGLAAVRRTIHLVIKDQFADPQHRWELAQDAAINITAWAGREVETTLAESGRTPRDVDDEEYDRLFQAIWQDEHFLSDSIEEWFWHTAQALARVVIEGSQSTSVGESLNDLFKRVTRESRTRRARQLGRRGTAEPLPPSIPQHTFPEAKEIARAIADGGTLRNWLPLDGQLAAMRHVIKDSPLETKLIGGPLIDWFGLPNTPDSLRQELQNLDLSAVLLFFVVIGVALEKDKIYVTATIDDLIDKIGMDPRSRKDKEEARRKVWRWLMLFNSLQVVGRRKGKWKDRDTGKEIDVTSRDDFLHIAGSRMPEQQAFDNSLPPLEVTLSAGPWLDEFRGDRRILADLGDVCRLASIPGGKASGAWARSIGLGLQQLWRERSSRAEVFRTGDSKAPTVHFQKPFTRREIFDLFPPSPSCQFVLESDDPRRARNYWDKAVKILKGKGIIGYYQELARLSGSRKGWDREWLDQPLDIRPANVIMRDVVEIAKRGKAARKAIAKKKGKPPAGAA